MTLQAMRHHAEREHRVARHSSALSASLRGIRCVGVVKQQARRGVNIRRCDGHHAKRSSRGRFARSWIRSRSSKLAAVPLSQNQTDILRLLAAHRDPERYVAGSTPRNRHASRYSGDIDVSQDRESLLRTPDWRAPAGRWPPHAGPDRSKSEAVAAAARGAAVHSPASGASASALPLTTVLGSTSALSPARGSHSASTSVKGSV